MLEERTFGQRLRALRVERGLSQTELAKGGMSAGYLSRLESGLRPPTRRVIDHLALRLGVPAETFSSLVDPSSSGEAGTSRLVQALASASSSGDFGAAAEALEEALHADDPESDVLRWHACWVLADLRANQARHDDERAVLMDLVALGEKAEEPTLELRGRVRLSRFLRHYGDETGAREQAERACACAAAADDQDRVEALLALVSAEAETGRLADARTHADELCALVADMPSGTVAARAHWASATVHMRQGDHSAAQELMERALRSLHRSEDIMLWMRLRLSAVSLHLQAEPPAVAEAAAQLDDVGPVVDRVGTELLQQELLGLRARLAFCEQQFAHARALCDRLDRQTLRLSFQDLVRFRVLCGELSIVEGRVDDGARELDQVARQAHSTSNIELAAEVWRRLAGALAAAIESDPRCSRSG